MMKGQRGQAGRRWQQEQTAEKRGLGQFIGYIGQPAIIVAALVGWLVGQAHIFGLMWPFGVAYLAAVRTQQPRSTAAALVGLTAGAAMSMELLQAAFLIAMYLLFLTAAARWGWRDGSRRRCRVWPPPGPLVSAVIALVLLPLLVRGAAAAWGADLAETLLIAAGEGVLAAGFFLLYRPAVTLFQGLPYGRQLSDEERLTVILLLATAAAGLTPWTLGHVAPAHICAAFLVLAAAIWGHRTAAPAAGAAVGTVLGLQTGAVAAVAGIYAVAGLAAGLARPLGRLPAVAAFMAAGTLAAAGLAIIQGGGELEAFLWGGFLATLLLLIIPEEKIHSLWAFLAQGSQLLDPLERANAETAAAADGSYETPDTPVAQAAALLEAMAHAMVPLKGRGGSGGSQQLTTTIDHVSSSICAGCPQRNDCWDRHFFRTYGKIGQLVAMAEEHRPPEADELPGELVDWCRRKEALVNTVNRVVEHQRTATRVQRDLTAGRRLLVAQLKEVADLIRECTLGQDAHGPPTGLWRRPAPMQPPHPPGLAVLTDSVQLAKTGQEVPGDSWYARALEDGRYLVMLSDGMGGGRRARAESRLILDLIQRLLEAGMPRGFSLRAVNTVLRLRSERERVATLDLALIDCYTGEAEMIKIGAAPTFILGDDGRCRTVESRSLPMGILREVDVASTRQILAPGDVLIMVSDGVLDAEWHPDRRVGWIQEYVENLGTSEPQLLARSLLAQARAKSGRHRRDDMLVVASQVMERSHKQGGRAVAQ